MLEHVFFNLNTLLENRRLLKMILLAPKRAISILGHAIYSTCVDQLGITKISLTWECHESVIIIKFADMEQEREGGVL